MRRISLFLVLTFYSVSCLGDKLEKAFEKLQLFDYFSAKEYFEKSMDDEPAAASYGLARIYSVNNNPFYNTDSARKYILISDSLYKIQKEKVKNYYREFGISDTVIRELSEKICLDAFDIASKADTSASYNHFIKYYQTCAQNTEVIELRNETAFSEAEEINTSAAFKSFMSYYPQALQWDKAQKKYDELIYSENTDSTIESYQFFIQNFPESPYRKQAEKAIYNIAVPDKTIDQYVQFARTYKNSPHNRDAWNQVYLIGMAGFTEQAYNDFKSTYPDYPYMDELETDYKLQNTFFIPFGKDDKFGYINDTGTVMIEPKFEEAGMFNEGLAIVSLNDKYGYINKAGKVIVDYQFEDAEAFRHAAAVVMKDSLFGLIDKDGQFIIQPSFGELTEVGDDIYMAVKGDHSAYVLRSGDTLTGFEFDVASDFKNGYAVVTKEEMMGVIDSTGKFSVTPSFQELIFINERFLKALNEDEMWGIINSKGDTILPFDYEAIGEYGNGLAMVVRNNKFGYIDEARRLAIPMTYAFTPALLTSGKFQNGYALLKMKYKSILIDTTGKAVSFKGIENYGMPSEGLFPVRKNGKWGFANGDGKIKIPCVYQSVEPFSAGRSVVRQKNLLGVIDTSGKAIIPPQYRDVVLDSAAIIVKTDTASGLYSNDGAMIIPCEYKSIEFISSYIVKATGLEKVQPETMVQSDSAVTPQPPTRKKYQVVNLNTGKVILSSDP